MRKLANSPTQPVELRRQHTKFLIRHTATPDTGPREKDASSAGSSEKSSFTKGGIKNGMGNSRNMRTVATAPSMAVTVILWVFAFADIKKHSFSMLGTPGKTCPPRCTHSKRAYQNMPYTPSLIQTILSVPELHRFMRPQPLADYTAGGESPPASKTNIRLFAGHSIYHTTSKCNPHIFHKKTIYQK